MGKFTRRLLLGTAMVAALTATAASEEVLAALFRTGSPPAPSSSILATMTLLNSSGSTQPTNFTSPRFGHSFKKGDIPSGTAPEFLVGGVAQPYSWGLQSYWSDGSLKHATFLFRCGSAVAGSGSLAVQVCSGGTAPSASGFGLSDVYAQNIRVNAPGIGDWGNLIGNWYSYAANDTNLIKAYKIIDGDAGASFYIASHFTQSSGGAAHGQLICEHYVTLTKSAGGGVGLCRYHPRITQPYYNYDSPAKNYRVFDPAGLSWQYGVTPTVVAWNWPFNTVTFTGTNNSAVFVGAHNYRSGAQSGSGATDINVVPGYVTSTTEAPPVTATIAISGTTLTLSGVTGTPAVDQIVVAPGVADGTIIVSGSGSTWTVSKSQTVSAVSGSLARVAPNMLMFAYTAGLDTDENKVSLSARCGAPEAPNYVTSKGGTTTFVPVPICLHFGSLRDGDANGDMKWFQGTGSDAADHTVRVQYDTAYLHSTGLLPLWNISTATFTGTISGTTLTPTGVSGDLFIGMTVTGPGVVSGTHITGGGTGSTWTVGVSQTVGPVSMSASFKGKANGGTVKDIADIATGNFWNATPTWNPVSCGPLSAAARGGTGTNVDIGLTTIWSACDFFNQSVKSQMANKAMAFFSDADGTGSFKDVSSFNYLNVSNTSYTGMPAPSTAQKGVICYPTGTSVGGFTSPPRSNTVGVFLWGGGGSTDHKPLMAYYAWLVFGEDYFHQILIEAATGVFLEFFAGNRIPSSPAGFGIILGPTSAGMRANAWALRDLMLGAAVCAQTHPDGSQICTYLRDMTTANTTWMNQLFSPTYLGAFLDSLNRYNATNNLAGTVLNLSNGGFQRGYFLSVISWAAMACEDGNALTWLNKYWTWLDWQITNHGAWSLYCEYDHAVTVNAGGAGVGGITDPNLYGITAAGAFTSLTWATTSPCFTPTGIRSFGGYVPADGDIFIFDAGMTLPSGFSAEMAYISLNNTGSGSFDLALLSNPTVPIVPGSSGSVICSTGPSAGQSGPWMRAKNPPAASTGKAPNSAAAGSDSYCSYHYTGANMAKAAGATGYDSLIADGKARMRASQADFRQTINWMMQSAA